ncbi:MAG TPA: sigma-70 family RNA polymerase sigma factor [Flavipsychrobacter sp.]|nr:sigma-70 family RNA polymerase sigma factor [Flavipsychrobacter sp.]
MPSYSEQEIITGCKENNRVFQEMLYRQYYSLFMRICARYAMNGEDAEQLMNDGFLKIFNHISGYKSAGSFEGWMKRIVVNNCLDYLKSKDTKNALKISHAIPADEIQEVTIQADVIKTLEFKEMLQMIHNLPSTTKTVFNMYVFDGFAHKEIAKMLDITEGTSSWHLHHARNILQNLIKKNNAEGVKYEHKRI